MGFEPCKEAMMSIKKGYTPRFKFQVVMETFKSSKPIGQIAKSLVDNPDKVQVSQLDGEQSSIIELNVAQEDVGKVIGKQGRNAQAIRVILGAAGMKLKRRFNLEIIEKG